MKIDDDDDTNPWLLWQPCVFIFIYFFQAGTHLLKKMGKEFTHHSPWEHNVFWVKKTKNNNNIF